MRKFVFRVVILLLFIIVGFLAFKLDTVNACGWCTINGYDAGICLFVGVHHNCLKKIANSPWCTDCNGITHTCCCYNIEVCEPKTCDQLGKNCGTWDDGCEGTVNCGTCSGTAYPTQCSYGECKDDERSVWNCASGHCNYSCVEDSNCCTSHSYKACSAGSVWWYDSCNNREERFDNCTTKPETCDYGSCDSDERSNWFCSAAQCVYDCNYDASCDACVPDTCSDLGKECGTWDDGCGGTIICGDCSEKSTECGGVCEFYEKPSWSCSLSGQCEYACAHSYDCACFPSGYNADWIIKQDCVIWGREGLGTGNLTIASDVTVQINPDATLVLDPTYKIVFDGSPIILINTDNAKITFTETFLPEP